MKYSIAYGYSRSQLENSVNTMMADGWIPQGGITIAEDKFLYQAMTWQEGIKVAGICMDDWRKLKHGERIQKGDKEFNGVEGWREVSSAVVGTFQQDSYPTVIRKITELDRHVAQLEAWNANNEIEP